VLRVLALRLVRLKFASMGDNRLGGSG